ncbi:MAG: L,D-transpeptidase family protein [Rhizobiaceae bacterium]
MSHFFSRLLLLIGLLTLASCQGSSIDDLTPKAERELPAKMLTKIKAKGMSKNSAIMLRLFKDEHVVEVWKQKTNGRFDMIANYNICAWSGTLGPKFKEGDRQAPEGYYPIKPAQLNPSSKFHLALNTGYPNKFDQAHGRTGSHLMIHGACSSSGCYSITDDNVQEIFAFARDAFEGGQTEIMLEALPFRMTPEKMALYAKHKDHAFWQMLKEGYDYFELTKTPPKVDFCEKKYVFNRVSADGKPLSVNASCPPLQHRSSNYMATYQSYEQKYQTSYAAAAKKFANTPFPIVQGGKSRPLDKKWKPQPVRAPRGIKSTTPLVDPIADETIPAAVEEKSGAADAPATNQSAAIATPATKATEATPGVPANAEAPVAATTAPPDASAAATPPMEPSAVEGAAVPVPTANPTAPQTDAPAVEAAPAPAPEPAKKKKWWQL